jgi:pSer/pThr/pTyr-binding forkhead associated (FHA) protein
MRFCFDVQPLDGPPSAWTASGACVRIGRDPANDLVLTSEIVSARHALIEQSGTIALLRDLQSSNGVFLNGARIAGSSRLSVGDVIMLGQRGPTLRVGSLDADAPVGATMAVPVGRTRSNQAGVRIGRAPDNDFVLDDPSVSAYHARFFLDPYGRGFVEDSGSLNGVAVGDPDRKVSRSEVNKSDRVYFGSAPLPAAELFARCGSYGSDPEDESTEKRSDSVIPLVAMFVVIGVAIVGMLGYMTYAWKAGASPTEVADKRPDQDPKSVPNPTDFPATLTVPPIQKIAAPPASTPPAREEPLDMIALARTYAPSIVLVGFFQKEAKEKLLIPRAVAWAIKPTLLVTTAKAVAELKYFVDKGDIEAFVRANDTLIPIKSFRVSGDFVFDNPQSDGSRRHAIGLLELGQPIDSRSPVFPKQGKSVGPDSQLAVVGYVNSLTDGKPYDRVNVRPESGLVTIRAAEDDRPGLPPLYSVELPPIKGDVAARWLDGSPIFNSSGAVVGILSVIEERIRMISWTPTSELPQ